MIPAKEIRSLLLAFAALLLLAGISSCSLPVPEPVDRESSAIGIAVTNEGYFSKFAFVYFALLDQSRSFMEPVYVYKSNYRDGGQYYRMNMPPGKYAAVAAGLLIKQPGGASNSYSQPANYIFYFPKELIQSTVVTLGESQFAFSGRYKIRGTGFATSEDWDGAQLRYLLLLQGKEVPPDIFKIVFEIFEEEFRKIPNPDIKTALINSVLDVAIRRARMSRKSEPDGEKEKEETPSLAKEIAADFIKKYLPNQAPKRREYSYPSKLKAARRDKEAEIEFLRKASGHFKKTGWAGMVERRMAELASN